MKSYELIRSEPLKGKIKHVIKNRDKEEELYYFSVRGGLNFDPPFLVVAGEEFFDRLHRPAHGQGVLRITEELGGNVLDLGEFLDRLSDAVLLHRIDDIYADTSEEAFCETFRDWADRRHFHISLATAPYIQSVAAGISLIRSWDRDGLLRLDEDTIVHEHLKALAEDNLDDPGGPLNALRFVIAGFSKYPPIRRDLSYRPTRSGNIGPHGWMAG